MLLVRLLPLLPLLLFLCLCPTPTVADILELDVETFYPTIASSTENRTW